MLLPCAAARMSEWDWAKSYKKFEKYKVEEDDGEIKPQNIEEFLDQSRSQHGDAMMGHYHDHHDERVFFEKPEQEKMRYCERHRVFGNALYEEGMLQKAAEQYQLTMSYYEYCFPDSDEKQAHLDELRNACLCNISLCYYRMGEMRKAIACASKVLAKHPLYGKALYRRAKAHLALDEYDRASEDLTLALSCSPMDKLIMSELEKLRKQKGSALQVEREVAERIMTAPVTYSDLIAGAPAPLAAHNAKTSALHSLTRGVTSGTLGHSALYDNSLPLEPAVPAEIVELMQ